MTTEQTYWNGEPCGAQIVRVIVADGPFPVYWARSHIGEEREAVQVNYGDQTFYIDNEDGSGWRKVTVGRGSPAFGHRSLRVDSVAYPCRVCGWDRRCGQPPGEDCHS